MSYFCYQSKRIYYTETQEEYRGIAAETGAAVTIFSTGNHPAILSNAERAADVICRFQK